MNFEAISHSGIAHDDGPPGRGSGRYPWGSGENPGQHQFNFMSEVKRLKQNGYTDSEIARALIGVKRYDKKGEPVWATGTDLKARITIESSQEKLAKRARALKLYDECHGNVSEVGRRMGVNESTVRGWLKDSFNIRNEKYENTAELIKKKIEESTIGAIDVSGGTELWMGVNEYTKNVAVSMLEQEGYIITYTKIPMAGTNNFIVQKVVASPPGEGETPKDVVRRVQQNKYDVGTIDDFSPDGGKTWWTPEFPESLDSSRIQIRYAEEGGKDKDGVIELRRGVEDISLGKSQYAQVRIAVDGTNYMKGMAVYGTDMPEGVDVIFNTNKHKGTPMIDKSAVYDPETGEWSGHEVLKRLKINNETGEVDRDNPFGALIKSPKDKDGVISAGGQRKYIDKDGNERLSPINKLQDEGDWDSWSRTLSSQFLSKQPLKLIQQQIDLSVTSKKLELEEIKQLTNPAIKKKMLEDYAKQCDANAADLSVRGVKNQAFQVILPVPKLGDKEVYAPGFDDGDTVALVRYPHGGTFEIPVLKVNNKNKDAKAVMENAKDAVGINSKVAAQLSGADFDGDTVLVIPVRSNRLSILSQPYYKELENFDPKELYKLPDSAPSVKNKTKQIEMGKVTNLITDMTVNDAPKEDIVKAVKHSMVVIDSEKHHLDYKQSAKDNDINALKKYYQGTRDDGQPAGASTILSRASAEAHVNKRKVLTDTKKMTPEELEAWNEGKVIYRETGATKTTVKTKKDGSKSVKTTPITEKVTQMDIHDDARELVRDPNNPKEMAYANYANTLKGLANSARKEARSIKPYKVSDEAKKTYAAEVDSLNAKLANAEKNRPKERRAQALANAMVSEKLKSNPDMDYEHKQRERSIAITKARATVGAKKDLVVIEDKEYEAIQARAISFNKLTRILNNTDQEKFKQRATPKRAATLSEAEIGKARAMLASGMYTNKEVADSLGVSVSTVINAVG